MKKHIYSVIIYLLLASYCLAEGATAPPPAGLKGDGARGIIVEGGGDFAGPVVMGVPISAINVEKKVWEQFDVNGDLVAQMTTVCSDITDGSQDCAVKIYVMIAGVSTLVQTLDAAPAP
jgi:hypothetical protein